jgi:FAD-linked sulfhydryl oxidase
LTPDKDSTPLKITKEQLGRNTWILLHSTAAAYPVNPTEIEKKAIYDFLHNL